MNTNSRKGFTLVEVLVAMFIGVLILGAATSSMMLLARSTAAQGHYVDMNGTARRALDVFASDIRMGHDVSTANGSYLAITSYDEAGNDVAVVYRYSSSDGTLTRTYGGTAVVVMTDLSSFSLSYYTHLRVATSAPEEVKEVQIEATMSKNVILTARTNEIISARYMMRNRQVNS